MRRGGADGRETTLFSKGKVREKGLRERERKIEGEEDMVIERGGIRGGIVIRQQERSDFGNPPGKWSDHSHPGRKARKDATRGCGRLGMPGQPEASWCTRVAGLSYTLECGEWCPTPYTAREGGEVGRAVRD